MNGTLPNPEVIAFEDGVQVTIRPIRPDDAPRLRRLFHRLSPESIFRRFLAVVKDLTEAQARRLAKVDYVTAMAFVAACEEAGEEEIIGVARYSVVEHGEPGVAEAAVVVEDRYQRRGLGTLLLNRLITYARAHGVRTFLANVHPSNDVILGFVRRSGLPFESRAEAGTWEMHVRLDRDPPL